MTNAADWLTWLESSSVAAGIRQSLWLYPFLEIVHIVGIVLLVGAAFMFDLRLLGCSPNIPVGDLSRHLIPWSRRGLLLIAPSGILLFLTNAQALSENPVFWVKMLLILMAALNALVFHRIVFSADTNSDIGRSSAARTTAIISIAVWTAVIACGRLLAY